MLFFHVLGSPALRSRHRAISLAELANASVRSYVLRKKDLSCHYLNEFVILQTEREGLMDCLTGTLDRHAIDVLLRSETIAHLACIATDGQPYVVPITYAYDGHAFYSYSADGRKLDALRANPSACIVVDRVEDDANWVSVIAWGSFVQLSDGEAADALRMISLRLHTVAAADDAQKSAELTHVERIGRVGVVYRIAVTECTGRYSTGSDR